MILAVLTGKRLSILLAVCTGVCLLPFVWLAQYAHPYLDDYLFPPQVTEQGLYSYVTNTFFKHSGRFSSSLITALHPFCWGVDLGGYRWSIVGILLTFGGSVYAAGHALLADRRLSGYYRWGAGSLLLCLLLLWLPSPTEAFYWLISAQDYLGACIAGFGLLAGVVAVPTVSVPWVRRISWGLLAALCFFTPAFSEMTACITLVLALLLLPLWYFVKADKRWWFLVGLAVLGAVLTLGAPGNYARMHKFNQGAVLNPLYSLVSAAIATAYALVNWIGTGILVPVTLLLLPSFGRLAGEQLAPALQRLTRYPLVWPLWTLGGTYACFALTYLALGHAPAPRCLNVVYIFLIVGWLFSVYGGIAWWVRRGNQVSPLGVPMQGLLLGFILIQLWNDHDPQLAHVNQNRGLNAVFAAYRDILSGRAMQYDREQRARYQLLTAPTTPDVVLPALSVQVESIQFREFSADPRWWGNEALSACFGKRSIRIAPTPAGSAPIQP